MSILDEIAKLKGLLDDGAITQEEYDAQKAKLFASEDGVKGGPTGAPRHVPGTPYANRQEDVDANRVFGIISYIFCLSLVTTFAAPKESQYARFHANQGLVLFIV
ncbi:MAG: SHOCT domain-containing protein, partial [Clostridiales Family XIII bacterium]|nr:SHOCT domain-containing protein [Clostridiales Family XIII bacterium]